MASLLFHYRPPSRPDHVYVINYKTSTGSWEPLFDARGNALYQSLMAELDAIKDLRPTGGLMLRRDGSSLPWFGKGEMLTQVQRVTKKIILAAGLRAGPKWRHHRSERLGINRDAVDAKRSVVLDRSHGALPARR